MAVIGIDLGTTNSLAVCWKDGKAQLLKNALGEISTPSVVSVSDTGEILVGKAAKERLISHPEMTAAEFKRSMGLAARIPLGNAWYTPEELSALVLRKLRDDAEAYLGEPVTEAVISVPAYFDDNCRSAVKHAAQIAQLNVDRLVNEPSAAALAYQSRCGFKDGTFMVVDFGGGTLDISIVDAFDGVVEILAVTGDNHLGGKDFNDAIAGYFCRENGFIYDKLSPDRRAAVYKAAESCKIALTSDKEHEMSVNIYGKSYSTVIDNNKLIEISAPIFERFAVPVKKALRDSKFSIEDIDDIVPVGGSCKMPTVRAFIEKITGKQPCSDIDPDTAIAEGAGIFAGVKERTEELKNVILTDICPFSLGTAVMNPKLGRETTDFIIERNSALPSSFVKEYYGCSDGQTSVQIKIYQGESIWPEKNLFLGELFIRCPPTPIGKPICSVRLTYDINGILEAEVTAADGKSYHKVFLSRSNTMNDNDINICLERMKKIKISPADKEENVLLTARAERIMEELLRHDREAVAEALADFLASLKSQQNHEIRRCRIKLETLLDKYDT